METQQGMQSSNREDTVGTQQDATGNVGGRNR